MFTYDDSRYDGAKVIRNAEKNEQDRTVYRRRFETRVMPDIPFNPQDTYIISRDGDRLDNLAKLFYGDASLWWYIAQANNVGKGTYVVDAGIRLRIPFLDVYDTAIDQIRDYNQSR